MPRSTKEWTGASDDAPVPPRVRLRQYDRDMGKCRICTRSLRACKWHTDHIVAIVNGGANRESNLQTLCEWCHAEKTGQDVAEKSAVYEKRKKHLGLNKPKGFWKPPGAKFNWQKGRYEVQS